MLEINEFARKNKTNISELVEQYFRKILPAANPKNIIDLVEHLDAPNVGFAFDFKKEYYENLG